MKRFEHIDLATARGMSENELTTELLKRKAILEYALGVDREDVDNFIAGIINMCIAVKEILDSEKER